MRNPNARIAPSANRPWQQRSLAHVWHPCTQMQRAARALCDRYEVHLIADEIAVGCGRTGTFFAFEQAALPGEVPIWPDLVCLSKGISGGLLPLSLVLCREHIYQAFLDDDVARGFLHSHSYTGNALACSAALAVLDRFEQDGVLQANRQPRERETPCTPRQRVSLDGQGADEARELLAFCSNDYLGLANHPALIDALAEGARRWGAGAGALTDADVGPCQFTQACAPHIAAAHEGRAIERLALQRAAQALAARADWLVIEGVGGFCVPFGADWDSADLACDFGLPVVLVVGLRLAGWVGNAVSQDMLFASENVATLHHELGRRHQAPCLGLIPRLADTHPAAVAAHFDATALRQAFALFTDS